MSLDPFNSKKNKNRDISSGAFLCDKETFKVIYRIEKRRVQRSSVSVYLFQIKFLEEYIDSRKRDKINKNFKKILQNNIRLSDVICQWHDNYFLLILYNLEENNLGVVKKRILNNYKKLDLNDEQIKIEFNYSKVS
jgi:GGDEF domain-containing protein